jgi:hypothetical protein
MLFTGSGDELCGLLSALFQAAAYHLPTVGLLLFQSLFTENLCGDQLLAPSPFSGCPKHPATTTVCPFQFLIYYSVLFLCVGLGSVCPGAMLVYPGVAVGILHTSICSPVGLCLPSRLELASGGTGFLLFSQCNVVWRSFVWAWGSGCQSFDSSWWFYFLPRVAPVSQQNF